MDKDGNKVATTVQCDCWDTNRNRLDCNKCGGSGTYARRTVRRYILINGREVCVMRYID
jgi:hypothetical protein